MMAVLHIAFREQDNPGEASAFVLSPSTRHRDGLNICDPRNFFHSPQHSEESLRLPATLTNYRIARRI
jgi:hypothetical protein